MEVLQVPSTELFEITHHIDERLGWITIFPSNRDWTVESASVLVLHLKEASDTLRLVASMWRNENVDTANVRFQTIQFLALKVPRTELNDIAQTAVKHRRTIDEYVAQLEGGQPV